MTEAADIGPKKGLSDNMKALQARFQTLSAITGRAALANAMGSQYGGDRDIYQALGYKKDLDFADFAAKYQRQDVAHAVIARPADATWSGGVMIGEPAEKGEGGEEPTPLEKEWLDLNKRLKAVSIFHRVDKLSAIGKYGIILLGLNDVATTEEFKKPVEPGKRELLYIKPLSQNSAKIKTLDTNTKSPRFNLPEIYEVTFTETQTTAGSSSATSPIEVHHSRVVHITNELMESEVYGTPQLEYIYNRLYDLEKLVGGSAEMFWRGARPGYQGKLDEDFQLSSTDEAGLQDELDEYENNLRRFLTTRGISYEALETQVSDPKSHVDVQISLISAATGIPKRILTGSERGELASGQDRDNWHEHVDSRRENESEPNIVRPFIDICIKYQVLPEAQKTTDLDESIYAVIWSDLFAQSEDKKAEVGLKRAQALKEYSTNALAQLIVSPKAFVDFFLGLNEDQIEAINTEKDGMIAEEEEDLELDDNEE